MLNSTRASAFLLKSVASKLCTPVLPSSIGKNQAPLILKPTPSLASFRNWLAKWHKRQVRVLERIEKLPVEEGYLLNGN